MLFDFEGNILWTEGYSLLDVVEAAGSVCQHLGKDFLKSLDPHLKVQKWEHLEAAYHQTLLLPAKVLQ